MRSRCAESGHLGRRACILLVSVKWLSATCSIGGLGSVYICHGGKLILIASEAQMVGCLISALRNIWRKIGLYMYQIIFDLSGLFYMVMGKVRVPLS